MKKRTAICCGIFVFVYVGFFLSFPDFFKYPAVPPDKGSGEKIIVNIPPGQGFALTARTLHEAGIVSSLSGFRWIARIKGADKKIRAGEYLLSSDMSPHRVLEILTSGKVLLRKLTIPEGHNLYQIAAAVAQAGLGTREDFFRNATDAVFADEKGIGYQTFEGYLFPDTYRFPKSAGVKKIIASMLKQFRSVFTREWIEQAEKMGFTVHQMVTLASVVEKETGDPAERPIIASVFHNRLRKKMRLQSDPTVIYGIRNFDGNLTKKHLRTHTPYNTYRIRGLPPGPIANPGRASLEAVLYPADTKFFYFVSKKDKTHKFSENLKEHNRAVRKYQLGKK